MDVSESVNEESVTKIHLAKKEVLGKFSKDFECLRESGLYYL